MAKSYTTQPTVTTDTTAATESLWPFKSSTKKPPGLGILVVVPNMESSTAVRQYNPEKGQTYTLRDSTKYR